MNSCQEKKGGMTSFMNIWSCFNVLGPHAFCMTRASEYLSVIFKYERIPYDIYVRHDIM